MNRILVVGDIMLDRYWYGDVTRLSQEAPVPVVKMIREECRAGAAANVAMNCASLGEAVTLIGIAGADESEERLRECLEPHAIDQIILQDERIRTTQKIRVIGRQQQIARVDIEDLADGTILMREALREIAKHDVIVLSDYGKGALADVATLIEYAKSMDKTVLVDPKGHDYSKYAGADVVKPNLDEIREMTGGWSTEDQLAGKVNRIRKEAGVGAILLTRGAGGMTLCHEGAHDIPGRAKEVFDVTGAGDTVMAALAVKLSRGWSLLDAANAANYAAAIVVAKFGTATVSVQELEEVMRESN